ncbi:3-oxo-tetronate kinase [Caldimonas tepidiphila]|uniref:3-oxo-tetronate kinase n=1 Tax=Caldimonas tepidiphila TaxID=2315841 RepID=UPI000E5A3031|nr:3-oxo-tetronate kinase [Caldimonas tepidiphila]
MSRPLLGCIADDFTGATDLANNLVRAGMRAVQTIGVPGQALDIAADAVVVALKSRTLPPQEAVAQSLGALRWLQAQGVRQVYFKYCSTFDSTERGNIGPVADALLDALHPDGDGFTIACPALPENGRTVFRGHLFAGDALLSESGMQHHPLTPMTDPNLVRVLQRQTRRKVGLVPYDVVARGPDAIRARFAALRAEGVGIAIVDAISNEDLLRLGPALAGLPLVTAGSGVAIGLPQNWRDDGSLRPSGKADRLPQPVGLQAVLSGSCSAATNAQVRHFRAAGRPCFALDPLALASGAQGLDEALAWAQRQLARQDELGPLLIHATAEPDAVRAVQAELGVERAGALVEQAMAALAHGLIARGVRQLVVAGGETSGAVVQALGIAQMAIGPQIDPGVPWTAVRSPLCPQDTLHLALKSGNFGTTDFFDKAFARLLEEAAR